MKSITRSKAEMKRRGEAIPSGRRVEVGGRAGQCKGVMDRYSKIDILVNNAGSTEWTRAEAETILYLGA